MGKRIPPFELEKMGHNKVESSPPKTKVLIREFMRKLYGVYGER